MLYRDQMKFRFVPLTPKPHFFEAPRQIPKEELRSILKMPVETAEDCLKRWYWRALHLRIGAIKKLAVKIKRHTNNILTTLRSGLSNAWHEAIITRSSCWYSAPTAFGAYKTYLPTSSWFAPRFRSRCQTVPYSLGCWRVYPQASPKSQKLALLDLVSLLRALRLDNCRIFTNKNIIQTLNWEEKSFIADNKNLRAFTTREPNYSK